jgi:hypothetical protein
MIYDIRDLDDTGQRLRVSFAKAGNYWNTFAQDFFRIRDEFAAGKYGSDWTFARWLALKAGLFEESTLAMLRAHESALAAAERVQVRAAQEEKRRDRAIAAAINKTAAINKRAARALRQQDKKKAAAARAEAKARAAATAGRRGRTLRMRAWLTRNPPQDLECARLLNLCAGTTDPAELGGLYVELRQRIRTHRIGRNPHGDHWSWRTWIDVYIEHSPSGHLKRSYEAVMDCIVRYKASSENLTSEETPPNGHGEPFRARPIIPQHDHG